MLNENNLISKSRPLLEMKNSGYNMGELKILDTYLSRINPLNPDTARVTFTKNEYCKLLGVDSGKVRAKQLSKYTAHFLGNIVTLPRADNKKGYIQKPLFARAEYDEETKELVLECNLDPQVFDMFFNVDNIGYVKYILRNTIHFNSVYSFKLFMLIKSKQPATEFTIPLEELKEKLEATAARYEEFKFLNAEVLKKAYQEINDNEKTDMRFDFEQIKRGKSTTAIRFYNIKTNTPPAIAPETVDWSVPKDSDGVSYAGVPIEYDEASMDYSRNPMDLVFKTESERNDYIEEYKIRTWPQNTDINWDIVRVESMSLLADFIPENVHKYNSNYIYAIEAILKQFMPQDTTMPDIWQANTIQEFNRQEWFTGKREKTEYSLSGYYKSNLMYWLDARFHKDEKL